MRERERERDSQTTEESDVNLSKSCVVRCCSLKQGPECLRKSAIFGVFRDDLARNWTGKSLRGTSRVGGNTSQKPERGAAKEKVLATEATSVGWPAETCGRERDVFDI